ncbi:MAG: 30S ribosomal protein S7 [Alphaproteobacteria bacterium]|nr:MAG: 30S ribosomal protein S7 [Alphaproteobacteria bacterium]
MRRPSKLKSKNFIFGEEQLEGKMVNAIMKNGKKSVAEGIYDEAFDSLVKALYEKNPDEEMPKKRDILLKCIRSVQPIVEVKSRRVGGSTFPVPVDVRPKRAIMLAIRWIVEAARNDKGKSMAKRLAKECLNIVSGEKSVALTKRENTHKMAEANRAFAHYGGK